MTEEAHEEEEENPAMLALLLDPKIFNYLILTLFLCASVRWTIAGSWGDALYWAASFLINVAVTWGFAR